MPVRVNFLVGEQIERNRVLEENEILLAEKKIAASFEPVYWVLPKHLWQQNLGFQRLLSKKPTRVLTEASISGKRDELRGLKENVTVGRLIPARYRVCIPCTQN